MEAAQSLPELSKHLSVLKRSDAADATIISTLFALNGLNPTVSDLNSSRIHIYLSQNVAKRSGVTGELARHLIAKWKRLLPSSSSQSPPPPPVKPPSQEPPGTHSSQSMESRRANHVKVSPTKPAARLIDESLSSAKSSSKKAKTASLSPPAPPANASSEAQSRKLARDRLQGLFEKVM